MPDVPLMSIADSGIAAVLPTVGAASVVRNGRMLLDSFGQDVLVYVPPYGQRGRTIQHAV